MFNKAKKMSFGFCLFALVLLASSASAITNLVPQIQAVYGGSIRAIDMIESAASTNIIRIFVSTEFSANSVFYADLDYALDPSTRYATNNFTWRVIPDLNAQANFGTVNSIAAHEDSGRLFVADNTGLISCNTNAGSLVTNISLTATPGSQFLAVAIHEAYLVGLASVSNSVLLYFGALDSSGNFTAGSGSPINTGLSGINNSSDIGLAVNPSNQNVYVIDSTGVNGIRKSSAPCAALSGSTTFSTISLPPEASSWQGNKRLGFGPDGRMFVGGSSGNFKVIAYSDNDGTAWTNVNTGVGGTVGNNINASHLTNLYGVLFGGAISTNKGETGSWFSIGIGAGPNSSHPNDSAACYDPILDMRSFYCSSDQGIACSTNGGMTIFELNYGLEAVAIQDLDMTADKTHAWTASKSGLRHGAGAPMALTWTPDGLFPTGDGSPYYSIAIDKSDSTGNTIYTGNGNIYRSTDNGSNWTRIWAYESNTNGFSNGFFATLAANGQTIVAGFYNAAGNGGLLVSQDGGSTWAHAIAGMDVNDVVLLTNNTILVAGAYNAATGAGGIYNQSSSGTVRELTNNVSINSFALDSADGVYACGQAPDYSIKIYYKLLSDSAWTEVSTNGLPTQNVMVSGRGPVMTVGRDSATNDLPVIVIGHSLYYFRSGDSTWQTTPELTYPDGSTINVLYWDELMVGTSEGLYGQTISVGPATNQAASFPLVADFDGDGKADPAVYNTNGNWKIRISSNPAYPLVPLSAFLGGSGFVPLAADFDGDGKADPAIYHAELEFWEVKLSSAQYLVPVDIFSFGGSGWEALAGDFDGDAKADPALYQASTGTWKIRLSSAQYQKVTASGMLGWTGWQAIAADFDGDRKADPAIYEASTGTWLVMLSKAEYAIKVVLGPGFVGGAGYTGMAADFDNDGYADPTVADPATGHWQIKLSSGKYCLVDLPNFLGE